MTETPATEKSGKGKAFFDRAVQVAETGNWDFAIEMYVEGLKREPGNIPQGHHPLREVALKRKALGGKNPGMRDKAKSRPGKDLTENLAKGAYLLAKEPGSLTYMDLCVKCAQKLELPEVIRYYADRMFEHQKQDKTKPDRRVLELLINLFAQLEEYRRARQVCELALRAAPDDPKLNDWMHEMSAKEAIQKGKYEQDDRKFTDNIKDAAKQHDLLQKDSMTQRRDYLEQQVKKTRHEYEANPTVQGKIHALVDALLKFETTEAEAEAIAVLERAFKDTRAYQHKLRIGDVRIRQMSREYSRLKDAGDTAGATEQAHRQLDFEIAEFVERVENYPTDLTMRYELGRRYLIGGRFDEAIPLLQEAQRDARRHVSALNYLGQAFVGRNMLPEACDTYQRALRAELTEDAVKKIRYNLGDVLERIGDFEKAQEEFSLVAQIDYNYKDVRTRLDRIRAEIEKRRKP